MTTHPAGHAELVEALKPCPFCGRLIRRSDALSGKRRDYFIHPESAQGEPCPANSFVVASDQPERIKAWNTRAALAASEASQMPADGWVRVPKEPTPEMMGAWYRYKSGFRFPDEEPCRDTSDYGAYSWMLAAAPTAPAAPDHEGPADGK